ncbi:MAG: hypothetical protein EBR82_48400 [Caulobacteraceae bacterium]|nr:hypothetical protein [Caulobacteraceae bacterium]
MKVYNDIIIDAEFAALIPPLSAEERQQLEENIVEHGGARDPLVVWASKGTLTLLDGHNLKKAVEEGRPVLHVKRELKEQAREARREENRKKIAAVPEPEQAAAVADAKFATIVIDPPWDWGDEGDQDQLGRARPDYSTMTIEQLENLDVAGLADDDCHIYMWITNRSLPKGFRLLEAWGFRYITAITWVKPHFGMGNYFRGQTEHVLFGVKGSQPLKRKDVGTVFEADRGPAGHSSKPPSFLDLVESCSPGPFLEMFSRSSRAGWVSWGENTDAGQ